MEKRGTTHFYIISGKTTEGKEVWVLDDDLETAVSMFLIDYPSFEGFAIIESAELNSSGSGGLKWDDRKALGVFYSSEQLKFMFYDLKITIKDFFEGGLNENYHT